MVIVAPFTGAWIEIHGGTGDWSKDKVAPFTGAWIEILYLSHFNYNGTCRSLHGGVD